MELFGVSEDAKIIQSEEEYYRSGTPMDPISLIPVGTGLIGDEKAFQPSPVIQMSGVIQEVEHYDSEDPNSPNYIVRVSTYDVEFFLILRYEGEIAPGDLVAAIVWLYGNLFPKGQDPDPAE